ncbi:MAG: ATP-binding protein, partial [Sedimenticolaceae bacterium]
LSNLLVNALQAASARPVGERRVKVTADLVLQPEGHRLRFDVCDNGDGIDPQVREHLFEPFFTTRTKGTGLGLAIVRQIAELHRGTVELRPDSPRGTCAVLTLPLTPAEELEPPARDDRTSGELTT